MDTNTLKQLGITAIDVPISANLIDQALALPNLEITVYTRESSRGGDRSSGLVFKDYLESITGSPVTKIWVNKNSKGHRNEWHDHSPVKEVAVLYLLTPTESGDIVFRKDGIEYSITPYPGLMLMFSGNLKHKVMPNNSDEYRISIAANLEKLV